MSLHTLDQLPDSRQIITYQFHAFLGNKKTTPQDGLCLAALISLNWLKLRLGKHIPEVLRHIPGPEQYRTTALSDLPLVSIRQGFSVNVAYLPDEGIWTMRIAEPDFGTDPDAPPVPGRVLETNVAFRTTSLGLECGFQSILSQPDTSASPGAAYRQWIVRTLMDHPDFGFRQADVPLTDQVVSIRTMEQLKDLSALWRHNENQMPLVIFTQIQPEPEQASPSLPQQDTPFSASPFSASPFASAVQVLAPPVAKPAPALPQDPPYPMAKFADVMAGLCRVYCLSAPLFQRFTALFGQQFNPGDVLVLEPYAFGGSILRFPWRPNANRQKELMTTLTQDIFRDIQGHSLDFGQVCFLSQVVSIYQKKLKESAQQADITTQHWNRQFEDAQSQWKQQLQAREDALTALQSQLSRQRQYTQRLEQEKEALRQSHLEELMRIQEQLTEKEEEIAYLKRRLSRPTEHREIAAWVAEQFPDRLILHPRAVDLLADRSARSIRADLICDALDFLATDYWERRYLRLSTEEMYTRCSQKYGRPFEVKPTGGSTVEFTPAQYKIKYFIGDRGGPVDSALDYHLAVGNDPENLLRIYFLHDDERQRIVVGSLPRHLKAVTVR
ncbi:MAG TPA: hypothetical protein DIT49_03505 [Clostridiales bacterium]|nr:hypothetical protein [Clostridiales bacterium]